MRTSFGGHAAGLGGTPGRAPEITQDSEARKDLRLEVNSDRAHEPRRRRAESRRAVAGRRRLRLTCGDIREVIPREGSTFVT